MHRRIDSTVTPLREFPSGSSYPAKPSCEWLAFQSVRSPFAPLRLAALIGFPAGSSFRVRFVPSGSLFLEPLGTNLSLYQVHRGVNKKATTNGRFPHILFAFESVVYGDQIVKDLCKKRGGKILFQERW